MDYSTVSREKIVLWYRTLQDDICDGLENLDRVGRFEEDEWKREGGGGGRTRIIEGEHIEKGGVNFSEVYGEMPNSVATKLDIPSGEFLATGVSIVLHPKNPWVPIIHMNVRYFEMNENIWWFGGGIDITPHYVQPLQAKKFHVTLKSICDKLSTIAYDEYKKWGDDYFFIPHRNETRGVGGIFFDRLGDRSKLDKNVAWEFVKNVGSAFIGIYSDVFLKNYKKEFSEQNKDWQLIRRGRYVEFNLVYDRGTRFGLETGGRTESILMSLPPHANWSYNLSPLSDSLEAKTLAFLRKDIDWVNYKEE